MVFLWLSPMPWRTLSARSLRWLCPLSLWRPRHRGSKSLLEGGWGSAKTKSRGVRWALQSLPRLSRGEYLWSKGQPQSGDPAAGQCRGVWGDARGRVGVSSTFLPSPSQGLKKYQPFFEAVFSHWMSYLHLLNFFFFMFILVTLLKPQNWLLFLNVERNSFTQQIV